MELVAPDIEQRELDRRQRLHKHLLHQPKHQRNAVSIESVLTKPELQERRLAVEFNSQLGVRVPRT